MLRNRFVFVIILILLLSACTPISETPETHITAQPSSDGGSQNPYPVPETMENTPEAYPAPADDLTTNPYPSPEEIPSGIIPFAFDKPVSDGDTIISGTGPAGVPIEVVNVTLMRLVLAQGIIEDDNTFTFELREPLEKGYRLGIALAELAGTEWTKDEFANKFFNGSQAMNVPTVGFFFDTALVK